MEIEISQNKITLSGHIEEAFIADVLRDSIKDKEPEQAFLELLMLGARVKDVINTTATTQLLASSVEKVQTDLTELREEHEAFIRSLMEEIVNEDSDSDMNLVKRLFEWRSDFDEKLIQEFDDNNNTSTISKIKDAIDLYLARRESEVAQLLSLEEPENPMISRPLKSVYDRIQEILEKLTEDKGVKKGRAKATIKGTNFEAAVFELVDEVAMEFQDIADDPGAQGKMGAKGNNEGDIVVNFQFDSINKVTGKLVIECKHHDKPKSKASLLVELEKGVSNREADYGVLITNESGYNSHGAFPFWEDWGNRRAILVVEDDFTKIDPNKIRFAYLLARARVLDMKSNLDADKLDMVHEQIATIRTSFGRLSTLKGNHTKASRAIGDIAEDIKFLQENVGDELDRLYDALKFASEA